MGRHFPSSASEPAAFTQCLGCPGNQKNWSDNAVSQALSRICRILCHRLARIMLAALACGLVHKSCQETERLISKMKVFAAAANNNDDMIGHRGLSLGLTEDLHNSYLAEWGTISRASIQRHVHGVGISLSSLSILIVHSVGTGKPCRYGR